MTFGFLIFSYDVKIGVNNEAVYRLIRSSLINRLAIPDHSVYQTLSLRKQQATQDLTETNLTETISSETHEIQLVTSLTDNLGALAPLV